MHNLHGFTIHYKFKPDPEIIYKQYYRKSKKKKKILLRFHCLWQFHKIFTVSHCRNESKCCIINPSFLFFSQAFETNLSNVNTSKLNKLPFDHLYTRALLSSHLIENWHHIQNDRKRDYCREYCICQPHRYLARRAAYDWTYDSGRFLFNVFMSVILVLINNENDFLNKIKIWEKMWNNNKHNDCLKIRFKIYQLKWNQNEPCFFFCFFLIYCEFHP